MKHKLIPNYNGNISEYIIDWIALCIMLPIFFLGLIDSGEIFDIEWRKKK